MMTREKAQPPHAQIVGERRLDRKLHVWRRLPDGRWKCTLCGGVTACPSDEALPERFEPLTDEDRNLCRGTTY